MRLKQVHFGGKKIQMKILLLYVQPIRIFSSKSGMQRRSKPPFVTKGKHVILLLLIRVCKMMQKSFPQFQKHCNYLSVRQWWKKYTLYQIRKRKPFPVVQVANSKLEEYYIQRNTCIYLGSDCNGAKSWKKEYIQTTCGQAINTVYNHFLEQRCRRTGTNQSFDS